MKIQDLRVGNLLHFVTKQGVSKITGLSSDGFIESESYHGRNADRRIEDFIPIPITEDWLIKFGWVWNKETNSYEKYPNGDARMHLEYRPLNGSYKMFNYVLKALICERIWHVHQLQNLYFALTGEELILNNL